MRALRGPLPALLVLIFSLSCRGPALAPGSAAGGLAVMTFNIRMNTPADGPNAWPLRRDMAASTILFHKAALVGLQEALRDQIADLEARLPGYGWVGAGRDDGKDGGEFNALFFDQARLRLLESDTFWLSETPRVPGSRGWDAACNRVVTWAKLQDRATGRAFHAFNTHFDHMGQTARRESARLLRREIARIAGRGPAVVTGDFNGTADGEPYRILIADGEPGPGLRDARAVSALPPYGGTRSFNGFKAALGPASIIDHIFVAGPVAVTRVGIIADKWDGRFVSDHEPVLAEIVIGAAASGGR
jgi:endonuclease/exonuclease/phosphatase family metal-dependent hydrolase